MPCFRNILASAWGAPTEDSLRHICVAERTEGGTGARAAGCDMEVHQEAAKHTSGAGRS